MRIAITEQAIFIDDFGKLVSNSVGQYTADFEFSAEYAEYAKILVFVRDEGTPIEVAVDDQTGSVVIPWEVLTEVGSLKIGAYGLNGDLVRPTVWSKKISIIEGAAPGETAHEPTILPWEELVQRLGDLSELDTEDKSSLVAAINEVAQGGGGGGTSDHAELENRDAADQHPMSAITGLEDALENKADAEDIPTATSDLANDSGFLTAEDLPAVPTALSELTEDSTHRVVTDAEKAAWNAKADTDDIPNVPSWAMQPSKPSYTAAEVGAVTEAYVDNMDDALQEQIDALVSKSDVVDVVADYAALQAYDTTTLLTNDVVKVLSDSTHADGRSYYRWVTSGDTGSWQYIGTESIGYTKAEANALLNEKQNTISDLQTIRAGAALGATALQSVPSGYATESYVTDAINTALGDIETALASI